VEIAGDARQSILDAQPWFAEDTIPGGTYSGIDEDVPTVSVQAMIATRAGLDADTVEAVTRAIFNNVGELTIKTDFIGEDSALDGMSIPLHEGAQRIFGEVEIETPGGGTTTAGDGTETAMGNETDAAETTTADD